MIAAYRNIPQGLRETGSFCLWKYQMRDGRRTKLPYDPNTGRKARSNDQATFADYSTAVAALERSGGRYDGLGIGVFEPLVGIDIDHCIDAAGRISDLARDIIDSCGSYAEKSPSGEGVHILLKVSPNFTYEDGRYYIKNPNNGVELYAAGHTNRYLTLTGDRLNDADIKECDEELLQILERHMVRGGTRGNVTDVIRDIMENDTAADEETSLVDDAELLNRMLSSKQGDKIAQLWAGEWQDDYTSHSEADLALCNHLAFYCRKDAAQMDRLFRLSDLYREDKWDRKQSGSTYGRITIARAVDDCTEVWSPQYRAAPTGGVATALEWLQGVKAAENPRYTLDGIGASYLLGDYLKPTARYCAETRHWYCYDGVRWTRDPDGCTVAEKTKCLAKALSGYAGSFDDDNRRKAWLKFAESWCNPTSRKNIIKDAASVWTICANQFDQDGYLINCLNGTFDAQTMVFRAHDPDDLLTRVTACEYIPGSVFPRWTAFVEEIFPDDPETLDFVHRWLGYSTIGDLSEECMVMAHGRTTRNGKSTLFESVADTLGDYATTLQPEVLSELTKTDGGHAPNPELASLQGIRFVTIPEPKKTLRLDGALVKRLTGGNTISTRRLYEDKVTFRMVAHMTMDANRLPDISDSTVFEGNRLRIVPFERHFESWEQDPYLKRKFATPEARNAIFCWLIEGLKRYKERRLMQSKAMIGAYQEYKENGDKISRFLTERLSDSEKPTVRIALTEVYSAYTYWCRENGCFPEAKNGFSAELAARGVQIAKGRPTGGGSPTTVVCGKELLPTPVYAYDLVDQAV